MLPVRRCTEHVAIELLHGETARRRKRAHYSEIGFSFEEEETNLLC
jgi:hypothetical protein